MGGVGTARLEGTRMNRRRFLYAGFSLALSIPLAVLGDVPEEGFDYRLVDFSLVVADASKVEAMVILERMHGPLFDAIHAERKPLFDLPTLEVLLVSLGADGEAFREAYASFDVDIKVRQVAETARRLELDGVPVLLVGGRYLTGPAMTGDRERTIQALDLLVGRLRDSVRS